jgi:ribonuclease HI
MQEHGARAILNLAHAMFAHTLAMAQSKLTFKRTRDPSPSPRKHETLAVYTDGACSANGSSGARGGIGVYFGAGDVRNVSERLPDGRAHTNQRAELAAIVRALQITVRERATVVVHTDSAYSIGCATEWLAGWKRNGWLNSKRQPVANQDLVRALDAAIEARCGPTLFRKVKGHSTDAGNNAADRLATASVARTPSAAAAPGSGQ